MIFKNQLLYFLVFFLCLKVYRVSQVVKEKVETQVSFSLDFFLSMQDGYTLFSYIGVPGTDGIPGLPGPKGESVRVEVRK